ncbi:hypothetical protein ACFQVA_42520 [Actinomadura keratinilytica]
MAAANLSLPESQFSDGCRKLDGDGAKADADGAPGRTPPPDPTCPVPAQGQ